MPEATLESRLEVKRGPLAQIFPLFEPSTLQHSNEIMLQRESRPELRNEWLWTADFSMYRVENGESVLYFAPRDHNLIFRDIQNATNQLLTTNNYVPKKEGIQEVVNAASAGKALRINISDLKLQKQNRSDEYGFFDVDPDNLDLLNSAQRQFVQAIYGNSRHGNGVYVLDSQYVKKALKGKEDSAIARASRLDWAVLGSRFFAVDWDVGMPSLACSGY